MNTLKQEIDRVEKKTFTKNEIVQYIPNGKAINYSELSQVENLNSFMGEKTTLLLLLDPPNRNIGHFVLLMFRKQGILFFDPYGNSISHLVQLLDLPPTLPRLLNGLPVSENNHQFQKIADRVQTCGRWCVCRANRQNMNHEQFYQFFRFKNIQLDELVVLLTEIFLG